VIARSGAGRCSGPGSGRPDPAGTEVRTLPEQALKRRGDGVLWAALSAPSPQPPTPGSRSRASGGTTRAGHRDALMVRAAWPGSKNLTSRYLAGPAGEQDVTTAGRKPPRPAVVTARRVRVQWAVRGRRRRDGALPHLPPGLRPHVPRGGGAPFRRFRRPRHPRGWREWRGLPQAVRGRLSAGGDYPQRRLSRDIGPGRNVKLLQDVRHVRRHRPPRQHEPRRDLGVG
jgi:hypothetical protein